MKGSERVNPQVTLIARGGSDNFLSLFSSTPDLLFHMFNIITLPLHVIHCFQLQLTQTNKFQ